MNWLPNNTYFKNSKQPDFSISCLYRIAVSMGIKNKNQKRKLTSSEFSKEEIEGRKWKRLPSFSSIHLKPLAVETHSSTYVLTSLVEDKSLGFCHVVICPSSWPGDNTELCTHLGASLCFWYLIPSTVELNILFL